MTDLRDPLDWPLSWDYDGEILCGECLGYLGCAVTSTRDLLELVMPHAATCTREKPEPPQCPSVFDPPAKLNSEGTVMGSYIGGPVAEHEHRYYLDFATCTVPGCTTRRDTPTV